MYVKQKIEIKQEQENRFLEGRPLRAKARENRRPEKNKKKKKSLSFSGKETIEVPKIMKEKYNKKILNVYKISFKIKCEMLFLLESFYSH